jgi:D,D-heptose 1,7-bisphosphate phosphatase
MKKAIFIDKDGTLVTDVPYNVNPQWIRLEPFAAETLKRLKDTGYLLIIISNQAGVALGYFSKKDLPAVNTAIQALLKPYDVQIDGFYYCPHHPKGNVSPYNIECNCRKPSAGLIEQAADQHGIDVNASWMIGDILNDVEAGNRAGCQTILINNGNETEWLPGPYRKPDFTVKDWAEITELITAQTELAIYE